MLLFVMRLFLMFLNICYISFSSSGEPLVPPNPLCYSPLAGHAGTRAHARKRARAHGCIWYLRAAQMRRFSVYAT